MPERITVCVQGFIGFFMGSTMRNELFLSIVFSTEKGPIGSHRESSVFLFMNEEKAKTLDPRLKMSRMAGWGVKGEREYGVGITKE